MGQTETITFPSPAKIDAILEVENNILSKDKDLEFLERTNLSADSKAIILDISKYVIVVGKKLMSLGRKILTMVIQLLTTFPNTTFGLLMAMVLTALSKGLFAGIPLIGVAIAGFLKSGLIIFGLTNGMISDMRSGKIGEGLETMMQSLNPLNQLKT